MSDGLVWLERKRRLMDREGVDFSDDRNNRIGLMHALMPDDK